MEDNGKPAPGSPVPPAGGAPHQCLYCRRRFENRFRLRRHLDTSRQGAGSCPYRRCKRCQSVVRAADFLQHLKTHHRPAAQNNCATCGLRFEFPHLLRQHVKTRHVQTRSHKCTLCPKVFPSPRALSRHLVGAHSPTECPVCNRVVSAKFYPYHAQSHLPPESRPHRCPHCPKAYVIRAGLRAHLWTHRDEKRLQCTACGFRTNTDQHMKYHMDSVHSQRRHACPVDGCGKKFRVKCLLQSHMKVHKPDKNYKCSHCGTTFRHYHSLVTHERQHTGEKPYPCPICGKRFRQSTHRTTHLRTHTDERRFVCPVCGKALTQSSHLKTHMKVHTGEKNFECRFCDKKFAHRQSKTTHERQHTQEEPYQCSICGKRFKQTSALRPHMQRHRQQKEHECKQCGKQFYQRSLLRIHMGVHAAVKPYPCTLCDCGYTNKAALKLHMRKHTGEKPYTCHVCHESYRHLSSYRLHLTKAHAADKDGSMACPHSPCAQSYTDTEALALHINISHKKRYTCPLCNIRFSDPSGLRRHMRNNVCRKPKARLGRPSIFGDGDPDDAAPMEPSVMKAIDDFKKARVLSNAPIGDMETLDVEEVLPEVKVFPLPPLPAASPKPWKRRDSWESDVSSAVCDDSSGEDGMSSEEDAPWWEKEEEEPFGEAGVRDAGRRGAGGREAGGGAAAGAGAGARMLADKRLQQECHVLLEKLQDDGNMGSGMTDATAGEVDVISVDDAEEEEEDDEEEEDEAEIVEDDPELVPSPTEPGRPVRPAHKVGIGAATGGRHALSGTSGARLPGKTLRELVQHALTLPPPPSPVLSEIKIVNKPFNMIRSASETVLATQGYSQDANEYYIGQDSDTVLQDGGSVSTVAACTSDNVSTEALVAHRSSVSGASPVEDVSLDTTSTTTMQLPPTTVPSVDSANSKGNVTSVPSVDSANSKGNVTSVPSVDSANSKGNVTSVPSVDSANSKGNVTSVPCVDSANSKVNVTSVPSRQISPSCMDDQSDDSEWEVDFEVEWDSQKQHEANVPVTNTANKAQVVGRGPTAPKQTQRKNVRTRSRVTRGVAPSDESKTWHYDEDTCGAPWCKQPISKKVQWIQCDACNKWFHAVCLGVRQQEVNELDEFFCGCTAYS